MSRAGRNGGPGPQLLDRTFAVLGLFSPDSREWTTTEAARACDLPVPTTSRILSSLQRHGYLIRDEMTKRFRLGPAALELGRHARVSLDLRTASLPILRRLAESTGETVLLTALTDDRRRAVCLERVESRHALRLAVEPGLRLPLHAGASQKALLAFLPADEIEQVMGAGLDRLCNATITDPGELRAELDSVRRRGWATSYEETNIGVWGVAIALLDGGDDVAAALGLAGPRVRLPRSRVATVLDLLVAGASDLAATLALRTSVQATAGRHGRGDGEARIGEGAT